jgi:hypothetical protein
MSLICRLWQIISTRIYISLCLPLSHVPARRTFHFASTILSTIPSTLLSFVASMISAAKLLVSQSGVRVQDVKLDTLIALISKEYDRL